MGILQGKAIVVTGAGRGLGRAYALHAAQAGAAVVVNDVDREPAEEVAVLIGEAGGRAVVSGESVADPRQASMLIDRCVAEFGTIDGLVNNAGLRYNAAVWEDDPDRMRALIEVNVLGSMYCGSAATRVMRERGGGAIVNMASVSAVGQPNASTYSTSKGAIVSMTIAWAVELAAHGIRANAVCPVAWTRMAEADPRAPSNPAEDSPDRVAPLVTYLCSDRASEVTGQVVRFVRGKLYLLRQLAAKQPVLLRADWDAEGIADAFAGDLAESLEPFPAQRDIVNPQPSPPGVNP
jgi:NAD(P)-dependent dehydrogenase (short-subunit alcohol dehydrogenase family)